MVLSRNFFFQKMKSKAILVRIGYGRAGSRFVFYTASYWLALLLFSNCQKATRMFEQEQESQFQPRLFFNISYSTPSRPLSSINPHAAEMVAYSMPALPALPALPEGVSRRYATLAGFVLAALWIWVAFDRPYMFPKHVPWNTYSNTPLAPTPPVNINKPVEALPTTIEYPPVDSQAIRDVCNNAPWNETLVFTCNNHAGSLAQVRTSILTCVRYAIEAGATRLVYPAILHQGWDRTGMDYMFDKDHFNDSLRQSCPQITLIDGKGDVGDRNPQYGDRLPIYTFNQDTLFDLAPMAEWHPKFIQLLDANLKKEDPVRVIIIELGRINPHHDVYYDGKAFAYAFGNILKIRPDIRRLASSALHTLSSTYNLSLDVTEPIMKNKFLGVHLYTQEDTVGPEAGWPAIDTTYSAYENLTQLYLSQSTSSHLDLIYAGSSNQAETNKFKQLAKPKTVITKFDLLATGDERHTLGELTGEQQTLVDYLILQKASVFAGVGHSAFSWNVAVKRHTFSGKPSWDDGPNAFDDDLSHIYGKKEDAALVGHMWP